MEFIFREGLLKCGIWGDKVENLLRRVKKLEFTPAIRQTVIHCGTNNTEEKRNKIKKVNKLIRKKCSSILTPQINYIKQVHDWIDEENCLRIKYYYRDCLHLVELGNKKLSNTIIKAIKHSNLTMSMNTSKYKATTVLTREDFLPLSRLSTETFNPKSLSITPPHENTLFSEIVHQTQDSRCNNIISITKTLPQAITTGYMKSKLLAENLALIKTCLTTARQRDITKKKKTPIKKSQIYPTSYPTT